MERQVGVMSKKVIEGEGEDAAPYKIYIAGFDRYGKPDQPVGMVAECWTVEEVRAFRTRADVRYKSTAIGRAANVPLRQSNCKMRREN
jgi:hypothetical protein